MNKEKKAQRVVQTRTKTGVRNLVAGTTVPGTRLTPIDVEYSDSGSPGTWGPDELLTSTHRRSVFDNKASDNVIVLTYVNGVPMLHDETGTEGISPNVKREPLGGWPVEDVYLQAAE